MKRQILSLSAFVIAVGIAGSAGAATTVFDSKHNLGSTGTRTNHLSSSSLNTTAEVCVFCHTPHGSNTGVDAPLWNKKVNNGDYSMYSSPTLDTKISAKPSGVSLACLSCHDGTMAMDTFVNAPGSGNYYGSNGKNMTYDWDLASGFGAGEDTIGGRITNLGATFNADGTFNTQGTQPDLRNDHPISMPYAGSVQDDVLDAEKSVVGSGGATDPKYFKAEIIRSNKIAAVANYMGIFRDVTTGSGTAKGTVTDGDIRLFNTGGFTAADSTAVAEANAYQVQCASCHNPHGTDNADSDTAVISDPGVDDGDQPGAYPTFLQRPNKGSNLCRTCHIK